MTDPISIIYKEIGSDEPFYRLVDIFYARVENDPILRPLYPSDLAMPKKHLALFLIQRFGGKPIYSEERGHPRMRARHMPFKIGVKEKDAWMVNMNAALDAMAEFKPYESLLKEYFEEFATFMINQPD
jgi:hemoglobin